MKAIIFGSTGMVGKGVLLECLEDKNVEKVLLINRHSCNITHPKIKEIIHQNFYDFSALKEEIKEYDGCFFCMGISAVGLNEENYKKITYDITLAFAQAFASVNPNAVFCYVSGAGTDSTEKGSIMWARVKGKTENALLALPFKAAYMFRPGYIQPLKGVKSRTAWYNLFYVFLKPLYFLLKPFRGIVTDSVSIGKAMINAALNGYNKKIIESRDINQLSRNY